MGCCPSEPTRGVVKPTKPSEPHHRHMAAGDNRNHRQIDCSDELTEDERKF